MKWHFAWAPSVADHEGNPFSTRHIQPGALEYQAEPGATPAELTERLAQLHWQGQLVGPHGVGKSSLLEAMQPPLLAAGRLVRRFALHDGESSLKFLPDEPRSWSHSTLVIVDGYEQLSVWQRWRLRGMCQRLRVGLLITTHYPQRGLPILWELRASLARLQQLVDALVVGYPPLWVPTHAEIAATFSRHGDNLREALLELYDTYESHRREGMSR